LNNMYIGDFSDATGNVWIVNAGRLLIPNDVLIIGNDGAGQLVVSNATVQGTDLYVGNFGTGALSIVGGTMTLSAILYSNLQVGAFFGSEGTLSVTGGQLLGADMLLAVGEEGLGVMMTSNGSVQVRDAVVGAFAGSQGALSVAAGTNTCTSLTLG